MVDTAARLVDEVLPEVPVRQFVLSLPFEIRYRLGWDGKLICALLAVFRRAVNAWYRRQARAQGYSGARCGSVTFESEPLQAALSARETLTAVG